MQKILDFHAHVFPDKVSKKASTAIGAFYNTEPKMLGDLKTLLEEGEKAQISHFLVHAVATNPKQVSNINKFLADTVKNSNGKMSGFGALHPESDDIKRDFEELLSLGLKGVKLHPDIQGYKTDDYRMLKIYELCEENNIPVLMHCGDYRYDLSNPNRIAPILDIYKNLILIGAHFGGYTIWEEASKKLSKYDNFFVDTSSSLFGVDKKSAKQMIENYGEDRVLFGTDYPLWNPKEELDRFLLLDLSESQKEKILWKNGAKLLNL